MADLLPVGVVTGDDDRDWEPAHAEYSTWSGMDIHAVQMMDGNYTMRIEVEPEGHSCLF